MKSALKIDTRVRSLRSYLDEFEKGVFQVPEFQRDFLWSTDDIIQLFDSIRNKYPIGSIQFWQPVYGNSDIWLESNNYIGPYKVKNTSTEPKPIYILDGLQRLSSLFGCLINPEKYNTDRLLLDENILLEKFRIYYDLEKEEFFPLRKNQKYTDNHQVPLHVLINTADFRKFARDKLEKIDDKSKIDIYLDRADELSKIISEYEISSVDILNATLDEAVEIFWRVNKKGIQISKDWIVNALTKGSNFSLKDEIDKLYETLKFYNFQNISRELIFNCIQSSFGKLSFDVDVVNLIKDDKNTFIQISKKTLLSIEKAVKFLFENLFVVDNRLLPTNWHLIFITEFFNICQNPSIIQLEELKKWFWFTTYSNYFTVYSPSKRAKAFQQFRDFLYGFNDEILYIENKDSRFQVPKYKPSNFGSVRFCANVLFQLSKANEEIKVENCLGFESIKLIEEEKETLGNLVYKLLIVNDTILNYNGIKHTSLSFLLTENVFEQSSEGLFITNEMRHLFAQNKNRELIKSRENLIKLQEQDFIKSLGLEIEI
ncbi:DUF262 domain-containing protein [Chryseobacterium sp. Bi04]|uniref:DUF262 domain-containing protein n=1 Tax=Chryseobacterium sp. Bi04 TaxID=2822345 RepID=UPI001D1CA692|nr:DUF262 domain-containing protein [Chryseobacterium sp. Bi04]CAH0195480.1 hypothetical protein SRABI04_01847 [Chryseobacterium sp. Bi04]